MLLLETDSVEGTGEGAELGHRALEEDELPAIVPPEVTVLVAPVGEGDELSTVV